MYRKTMIFAVFLSLVLAGCQSSAEAPTPQTTTNPPPPSVTPATSTITPQVTEQQEQAFQCTAVSSITIPTGESPFPAISAADWKVGSDTALVRIIEYSDFQ